MKSIPTVKILVTGGHHTPAFAVIEALRRQFSIFNPPAGRAGFQFSIVWVGHRFSMVGDENESLEYKEVTTRGIRFIDFATPRFHRRGRFLFGLKFFWSTLSALVILVSQRPNLILSFGSYLSAPIVLAAWLLRIPAVTHEQTSRAGFANRFNANFCRRVLISFESSRRYFPKAKTVLTGNPIRRGVFEDRGLFKFKESLPVIYITGGKQGAHALNTFVLGILPKLLRRYNVLHQCGSNTVFDDYERLRRALESLPDLLKGRYLLKSHLWENEIGSALARSDLVIGRAGANTVTELGVLRKKSILVPLPGSSHAEQEENARLLKSLGLAEVVDESRLTGEVLLDLIEVVFTKTPRVEEEKIEKLFPRDAADRVAREILRILNLS